MMKSVIVIEIVKNERTYGFNIPVGAPFGEAYDACHEALQEILQLAQQAVQQAKPVAAESISSETLTNDGAVVTEPVGS
jgi:hypothetical protein